MIDQLPLLILCGIILVSAVTNIIFDIRDRMRGLR